MPIGTENLLGHIKDGFIRNGYKVIADTGGVRTTEVNSAEKVSQSEHKPRYKLYLRYYETAILKFCMVRYEYNIYIVDTKNGMEVMNMNGSDCEHDIAPKLFKALNLNFN